MKPFVGWTRVAMMGVLLLQVCVAAFAQEKREQDLGASPQSSPTGQTGAGTGNTGVAPQKPDKRTALGTFGSEENAVRFTGSTTATWWH
jgi:hypothetical protein